MQYFILTIKWIGGEQIILLSRKLIIKFKIFHTIGAIAYIFTIEQVGRDGSIKKYANKEDMDHIIL